MSCNDMDNWINEAMKEKRNGHSRHIRTLLHTYKHTFDPFVPFLYLPQFDGFVIGREKEVSVIFTPEPFDLIDFLLNFQRFQIVKLGLVALKRTVYCVFPLL